MPEIRNYTIECWPQFAIQSQAAGVSRGRDRYIGLIFEQSPVCA